MALDRNQLLKPVRKLQKLVKKMDSHPTPGKVHDLRTNTRRFEAIFEALSPDAPGIKKSILKDLGRLRRRAGKVRDMDVLLSYASTVHLPGEEECLVQLLEHLGSRRRRHAKKLHLEVQRLRPELRQGLKRTPAILSKLVRPNGDGLQSGAAAANATAAAVKLAAELAVPQRLSRENLHPYRLKVKQLRNVLQMANGNPRPKFVDDLGEVKDAIGEWHDWEELVPIAQEAVDHGNRCELLAELKRIAKGKYEHALALVRTLRKRYLQNAGPPKKGPSGASPKVPSGPALAATAMLAG